MMLYGWILIAIAILVVSYLTGRFLYKRIYAQNAKEWLDVLREGSLKGNTNPAYAIEAIRKYLKKSGYSLEKIGTSEEEIEGLRINCYRARIAGYLATLRKGIANFKKEKYEYDEILEIMLLEIGKCKFSLEDVGTSESELNSFRKVCRKIWAEKLVKKFRTTAYELRMVRMNLIELCHQIEGAGFPLEEIGISAEELEKYAT